MDYGRRFNATMSEAVPERIVHTFSSQERYVLINLAEQILELLGQSSVSRDPLHDIVGISGNELPPEDPVLKRLLPSAYQELQDAAEFRRYTEDSLRNKKREHAYRIREMLLDLDGIASEGIAQANSPEDAEDVLNEDAAEERVFVHGDNEVQMSSLRLAIVGDDCWAWLGGLNDIRLALAVRLDIGGTSMGDLPNDQHRFGSDSMTPNGPTTDSLATNSQSDGDNDQSRRFEVMKESDPMKAVFAVYSWLGWLQEDFLRQLEGEEVSESKVRDQGATSGDHDQPFPHP